MKVDFYQVEMPDGEEFKDALTTAKGIKPTGDARVRTIEGIPYRLLNLSSNNKTWEGDACRIRMNDVPMIASVKVSTTKDVPLTTDQGIAESTAFLYDEETNVLAIQSTRFGVSASRLGMFLGELAGLPELITLSTVFREDASKELLRMKDHRKILVRFAGIKNPRLITDNRPSVAQAVELLKGATAPHLEIAISVGHSPSPLDPRAVLESAKTFLKWAKGTIDGGAQSKGEVVEALKVVGAIDSDTTEELNLLEFKMTEEEDVPVDKKTKRLLYADRKKVLRSAFDRRQKELKRMLLQG